MKVKPLKWISPPSYPTRDELPADEPLLAQSLPRGWRHTKKLAGAASLMIAANVSGYTDALPLLGQLGMPPVAVAAEQAGTPAKKAASRTATVVAPVFEHGTGRGATGCVVITPPAFLSEEEALQVIKEVLGGHGVVLGTGATLMDVTIAPRHYQSVRGSQEKAVVQKDSDAKLLEVDGFDARKNIVVEFVSKADYGKLGGLNTGSGRVVDEDGRIVGAYMSTVSVYDFKEAAQYVSGELAKQGKQKRYAGVFYDPMAAQDIRRARNPTDEERKLTWEQRKQRGREEGKKLLRQQAEDFVAWLSSQEVI